MKKKCVYCRELIEADALVCKECENPQSPPWYARYQSHWITRLLSTAALAGLALWIYQTWSASDTDRRQRMRSLAESAEVLQATTEQLRQPCVASVEECEKRFIDLSATYSVNDYKFMQEARYFTAESDPLRVAIEFVDDFYNPGNQTHHRLSEFQYPPVQIAIARSHDALVTPFQNSSWCTADRRTTMRTLTLSLDIYRYCEMVIRNYAWEEATGGALWHVHNRTSDEYKMCTSDKKLDSVSRSSAIGDILAGLDDFNHSAPWLFDAYCGDSGLALQGGIVPPTSRQLLVVTTKSWTESTGYLVRYSREGVRDPWKRVGNPASVVLGKNGLGWGHGLMPLSVREDSPDPFKEEGDNRSPAGLFSLGPIYSDSPLPVAKMPVRMTTDEMYCDDRPVSDTYNHEITMTAAMRAECSASAAGCPSEPLRRTDGVYKHFIWINYNSSPAVKSAGSCIFLHLNHADSSPTAGCTTVAPIAMEELIGWLRPEQHPMLLQLPANEFESRRKTLNIPQ